MKVEDIITPEEDPSGKLAEFVTNLKFDQIPEEHIDFIKRDVLDELGCIIAGSSGPSVDNVLDVAEELGGEGKAPVLVHGKKMSTAMAGLVNGTMARARDMGDTHNTGGHICEWVIPTLMTGLGMDKTPRSGKDFITAFAVSVRQSTWACPCPVSAVRRRPRQ